jgi:replicative DNA helicase
MNLQIAKEIPNVKDFEEIVLGMILLESTNITAVSSILKPESFYVEAHDDVFSAMLELYADKKQIDILTVTQKLKSKKKLDHVGGAYFISALTNRVGYTSDLEAKCLKIQECFILRELIILATKLSASAYEPGADCFEIIDKYNKYISELTNIVSTKSKQVGDILLDVFSDIKAVQEHGIATGIMSGFENIDKVTGGWQKSTFIVLAARPGMGKTAFALALAKYPAIHLNKAVAIFSLEMSAKQLAGRLAASESDINSSKISQKRIDEFELAQMGGRCSKLINAPIFIDDTPGLKFSDLRNKARKLKSENNIEMIVIDYLQLMHGDEKGNREQEISYISRNLKALSKELDIPIIALSQLSRMVENRTGKDSKRPQLSDLRESGAIEQDADNVLFLFRPAYYDMFPEGYEYGTKILETKNLMLVDFAKGRELQLIEVPLLFFGQFMRIENYNLHESSQTELQQLENNDNFLEAKSF